MSPRSRPDGSPATPYRVEYAVRVWKQLFELPADHIALLGRELEGLAEQVSAGTGIPAGPRNIHVADLAVSYEVNDTRRVLTVLGVGRQQPAAD